MFLTLSVGNQTNSVGCFVFIMTTAMVIQGDLANNGDPVPYAIKLIASKNKLMISHGQFTALQRRPLRVIDTLLAISFIHAI